MRMSLVTFCLMSCKFGAFNVMGCCHVVLSLQCADCRAMQPVQKCLYVGKGWSSEVLFCAGRHLRMHRVLSEPMPCGVPQGALPKRPLVKLPTCRRRHAFCSAFLILLAVCHGSAHVNPQEKGVRQQERGGQVGSCSACARDEDARQQSVHPACRG